MYLWRQWQSRHKRFMELRRFGIAKFAASIAAGSPAGLWRMSGRRRSSTPCATTSLTLAVSPEYWFLGQLNSVEPPRYGPVYAKWCGKGGVARRLPIPTNQSTNYGLTRRGSCGSIAPRLCELRRTDALLPSRSFSREPPRARRRA